MSNWTFLKCPKSRIQKNFSKKNKSFNGNKYFTGINFFPT